MAETTRIFMQLHGASSGEIKGESVFNERRDWIELDNWNWQLGRSSTDEAVPEPSLLSFDKRMDRASMAMLRSMLKGEELRATIIVDDSASNLLELTIRLEQVTIRKYEFSTEISEVGGSVDEDWTFDYRWITFEYQANAKSGVKSIKLHRPLTASDKVISTKEKEKELGKLITQMMSDGYDRRNLDKLWEETVEKIEQEMGREAPLRHATTVPEKN